MFIRKIGCDEGAVILQYYETLLKETVIFYYNVHIIYIYCYFIIFLVEGTLVRVPYFINLIKIIRKKTPFKTRLNMFFLCTKTRLTRQRLNAFSNAFKRYENFQI